MFNKIVYIEKYCTLVQHLLKVIALFKFILITSSLAPSWRTPTFIVDTSLTDCTKNETANTIYKNLFNEILDASTSSTQMYTDAYKTSTGVGIAIIYNDLSTSYRFLEQNSTYTAEYKAILEGVK